ncbi:MAG: IS66 family transposase [Candidatus Symbiothrix sp.]|nr:IS66 family transposase [Candidatus Symbiothrix sp.]
MERWMRQALNTLPPKSPSGKAISYAFGMWPRISRCCHDGRYCQATVNQRKRYSP